MPRTCTVCTHAQLHAINKALVAGTPLRDIAGQYGLSKSAVERHQAEHLPKLLTQAQEAAGVAHALDVVQQLRFINGAALTVLKDARASGDGELVLKAVDRVMKQVELQARLLGDLDERPVVNVLVAPEWVALRGRIVVALAAFPEARVALAGVLDAG